MTIYLFASLSLSSGKKYSIIRSGWMKKIIRICPLFSHRDIFQSMTVIVWRPGCLPRNTSQRLYSNQNVSFEPHEYFIHLSNRYNAGKSGKAKFLFEYIVQRIHAKCWMKSNNSFTISPFHIRLCSCSHSQSSILHSFFHSGGFKFDDGEGKEIRDVMWWGEGMREFSKGKGVVIFVIIISRTFTFTRQNSLKVMHKRMREREREGEERREPLLERPWRRKKKLKSRF